MSKRVWIVGGSGAVGVAVRALLEARGHRVSWTYRTRPGAGGVALDVRDAAAIEAAAMGARDVLGGLDAMVYLAAIGTTDPGRFLALDDVTPEAWDEFAAVNLRGAFFASRAFARAVDGANGANGANIVLAGSIDGHKPVPASVPYAATKGALEAMVRALSKEFGPRNVRINALAPGVLEGGLSSVLPKRLVDDYLSHDALSRKGTLREVAEVFAYFAVENSYVTGRTIAVDGGL